MIHLMDGPSIKGWWIRPIPSVRSKFPLHPPALCYKCTLSQKGIEERLHNLSLPFACVQQGAKLFPATQSIT